MKKIIFSSLISVLLLGSCQNESKKEEAKTDTSLVAPPPPPITTADSSEIPPPPPEPPVDTVKVYDFTSLDTPPTYPGGIEKLYQFIGETIKYPPMAIKNKTQGNVHLSFVVEKDGSVTDIKVEQKLGSGTDEEAVRVLKMAKRWNPGKDDGKLVRAKYRIPIKFKLSK